MKSLTVTLAALDLDALHAELVAAAPALLTVRPDGSREANYRLSVRDRTVTLDFPDEVPEKAMADVLAAHKPVAKAPAVDPRLAAARAIRDATTLPQVKTALLAFLKAQHGLEP